MKELVEKINAACAEFAKNAEAQVVKGLWFLIGCLGLS